MWSELPHGNCDFALKCIDNNDTVSNSFIWFHSKNETIKRKVKLSFGAETMLISLSNWNLFDYLLLTMIYALSVSKTFATFIDDASIREIMLSGVSGYILTLRVPISMYSL